MRILIAEDDAVSRTLLSAALQRAGYDVEAAHDGEQAWAAFERLAAPTLAILDWMMPGVEGTEICRRVRARSELRGSYVILLTAKAQRQDVLDGLQSGADDYLTKPFDRSELLARVRVGERTLELQAVLARRVAELEEALRTVKTLEGLLPICCYCKRIRQGGDYWQNVEEYVTSHSRAEFTHGICPDCLAAHFKE
jgi:DNA-binding response OmpR family regulator